ncbi:hypothetical protein BJV85_003677 [Clostridium acetobutylicum]|nr:MULTISPECIES: hypothetical protein [Clostridium]MBC2395869.1 hypothetical protein [Clostridium acetobutylicum]MBC2585916.1 hypothetical protein [Clostridium acetobutylicum]NOV89137.1 hypothetical protein [Clostridium acetobutylicum]NOW16329.1 hypothetical protein [Clostridium acetobutylicum]NRY58012.1 hypothetical protein [Clostridium acetobutylicum]
MRLTKNMMMFGHSSIALVTRSYGGTGQINTPIKVKSLEDVGILRNIWGW